MDRMSSTKTAAKSAGKNATAKKAHPKATATKKPPPKTTATKATAADEGPIVFFESQGAWADWLASSHSSARGLWLKLAKKASGKASVTYEQAVEVALAWGWIDGLKRPFDADAWLQRFTPRNPKSVWSKINRDKALALIKAGKMMPPGLAEVERAQKDGRWDAAYDSQSRATVPNDLAEAFAKNPRAAAFFAELNAANRYAVIFRIQNSKKAETRAKNIARFVEMLARHEKLYP